MYCDVITRFLNVADAYSCTVIETPGFNSSEFHYSKLLYGGQQRSLVTSVEAQYSSPVEGERCAVSNPRPS
jgi:hypothetical protein